MSEYEISAPCQVISTIVDTHIVKVTIDDMEDETHYLLLVLNKNVNAKDKDNMIYHISKNIDPELLSNTKIMEISYNQNNESFFVHFIHGKAYWCCKFCNEYTCIKPDECDDVEMTEKDNEYD